jgi:hypothetical protein
MRSMTTSTSKARLRRFAGMPGRGASSAPSHAYQFAKPAGSGPSEGRSRFLPRC